MLSLTWFTPGHISLTIFLMTAVAFFCYITDSKPSGFLESNIRWYYIIGPTGRKTSYIRSIFIQIHFLPRESILCIHIALCFLLAPMVLIHNGTRAFHFLKMRVITQEKGSQEGLRREGDYTESGTQQHSFGTKDTITPFILCMKPNHFSPMPETRLQRGQKY